MLVIISLLLSAQEVTSFQTGNMSRARLGRTRLLEDLRNHRAFTQKVSPGDKNNVVYITFQFFHYQMLMVDETTHSVTSVGHIIMTWLDSDLTWNRTDYGGIGTASVGYDEIWFPMLIVSNAADPDYVMIQRTDTVSLTSDGVITYSTSAYLKTTCDMDVTYYPFDTQTCLIVFLPYIFDTNFSISASSVHTNETLMTGEWIVTNKSIASTDARDQGGIQFILFTMTIRRRILYYVLCVLTPMLLTGLVTSMVFLLPPDSGEKISFLVTVFVTDAVFLNFIAGVMPRNMSGVPRLPLSLVVINVQCVLAMVATVFVMRRHDAEQRNITKHQQDSNSQHSDDKIFISRSALDSGTELRLESTNPPRPKNRLKNYVRQKLQFSQTRPSPEIKPNLKTENLNQQTRPSPEIKSNLKTENLNQQATRGCCLRSQTWNKIFFWTFNLISTVCYFIVFLL